MQQHHGMRQYIRAAIYNNSEIQCMLSALSDKVHVDQEKFLFIICPIALVVLFLLDIHLLRYCYGSGNPELNYHGCGFNPACPIERQRNQLKMMIIIITLTMGGFLFLFLLFFFFFFFLKNKHSSIVYSFSQSDLLFAFSSLFSFSLFMPVKASHTRVINILLFHLILAEGGGGDVMFFWQSLFSSNIPFYIIFLNPYLH